MTGVLHGNEIFLDAGAHRGCVSETFIERTGGAFRQIVAIEPDPASRARLVAALPDDRRISIYDCALAEDERTALFHDGLDYASQLSETGHRRITTRPLDALGLAPSFVKLHLEGAELAALKGARKTLLTNRPIIIATVYHNADGLWRTPLWLMETCLIIVFYSAPIHGAALAPSSMPFRKSAARPDFGSGDAGIAAR